MFIQVQLHLKNYGHLLFLIILTNKLNAAESQYALSSLSLRDF